MRAREGRILSSEILKFVLLTRLLLSDINLFLGYSITNCPHSLSASWNANSMVFLKRSCALRKYRQCARFPHFISNMLLSILQNLWIIHMVGIVWMFSVGFYIYELCRFVDVRLLFQYMESWFISVLAIQPGFVIENRVALRSESLCKSWDETVDETAGSPQTPWCTGDACLRSASFIEGNGCIAAIRWAGFSSGSALCGLCHLWLVMTALDACFVFGNWGNWGSLQHPLGCIKERHVPGPPSFPLPQDPHPIGLWWHPGISILKALWEKKVKKIK